MISFPHNDDELLRRLLGGDAAGEDIDALAARATTDPALAARVAKELAFSEMLRQALAPDLPTAESKFEAALETYSLTHPDRIDRILEGSANVWECDQVAKSLWESAEAARELRRDLARDEWFRQAISDSRSEEAFLLSLETRMWAETKKDHFVDDFAKRLEQEISAPVVYEPATADNVIAFPSRKTRTLFRVAAVAAVLTFGAFVVVQLTGPRGPVSGSVVKASRDVVWSEGASPRDDGTLSPGMYELRSGVVALRMNGGSELTVQAPARFEVGEDASAEVINGIALARNKGADSGGELRSRGLTFADSAGFIGIDARSEGATEAIVIQGGGGVCLTESGKCRELSQFEAVKADHRREKLVDVPYNPRAFSKAWALMAGVEDNLGPVRVELPGSIVSAAGGAEGEVRVFVENEAFRPAGKLEVDRIVAGSFAKAEPNDGQSLVAKGELRSYLLQLTPAEKKVSGEVVETSLTFDHPVVGVIFSSDRLENSDATVGAAFAELESPRRGLDSGSDEILLSEDRRTLNLRFHGDGSEAEQVRVLVALK